MVRNFKEKYQNLNDGDRERVNRLVDELALHRPIWHPHPGPQTQALESEADILLYGGAAGGGKSDLILGAALTQHTHSIIYRREYPQFASLIDRGSDIIGLRGDFNQQKKRWTLTDGKVVELGAIEHDKDKRKYQGRPHDLMAFDELTQFSREIFTYLQTWLRTADKNQRTRIICASNPPTDADGRWVIDYWGPWLSKKHPNPAKPGELRWFVTLKDGTDMEVPGPGPHEIEGEEYVPLSRTFIPSKVSDNPTFKGTDYERNLKALPPVLRSIMYEGNFHAGMQDDDWQIIPTEWVELAQVRWKQQQKKGLLSGIGVDIARGGLDFTVIVKRYGNYFDKPVRIPGEKTPDGQTVLMHLRKAAPKGSELIVMDSAGVGAGAMDIAKEYYTNLKPINHASGSLRRDKSGRLKFTNKRAEIWWRFREALDPDSGEDLALPDDPRVLADLTAPTYQMGVRGITVEDKEKIKKRIGRSPDEGEAIIYAYISVDFSKPRRTGVWG